MYSPSLIVDIILEQDIIMNRSIKDALVAEEKFFRSRLVWFCFLLLLVPRLYSVT
jgi:hypothetical protein